MRQNSVSVTHITILRNRLLFVYPPKSHAHDNCQTHKYLRIPDNTHNHKPSNPASPPQSVWEREIDLKIKKFERENILKFFKFLKVIIFLWKSLKLNKHPHCPQFFEFHFSRFRAFFGGSSYSPIRLFFLLFFLRKSSTVLCFQSVSAIQALNEAERWFKTLLYIPPIMKFHGMLI